MATALRTTSLYEVVSIVQDIVASGDDAAVVAIVSALLHANVLRVLPEPEEASCASPSND